VDREELGIQAGDAFKETKVESTQRFAEIFGIKELGERELEGDTRVHIATVQAMAQRLLLGDEEGRPTVDSYDPAALGDPLVPYEQRVEQALQRILASRSWTKPQRDGLQHIANQTKATRSWIATPSTTTCCSSSGKAAAGRA